MNEPQIYTSRTILEMKSFDELLDEYCEVMRRLHGMHFSVSVGDFKTLLIDQKELVVFVLINNELVATAQASLLWTPPNLQAYINGVVTKVTYGGRGLGRLVMSSLESAIQNEWGQGGTRSISLALSNSPKKDNGGFYQALGWISRAHNTTNPTVMWVKTI